MKVAVMGAGAVGCYYGGMLARAGHEVVLIGRAQHVAAVRRDGLLLDTLSFLEHVPLQAATDAGAAMSGAILVGLGLAATPALVTAAARSRSSASDYARAFSIATAAMGLGQLAGPVLAGGLADAFGAMAAPLFAAGAYALGATFATIDRRVT